MTRIFVWSALIVTALSATLHAQSTDEIVKAFTPSSGWRLDGSAVKYAPPELERFAPSRAADLRRYGIRGVTVQNWVGAEGRLRATIYDMIDSAAAYGVFSIERDPGAPGYATFSHGAEGFQLNRRAVFWQGRYVIDLEGDPAAMNAWAGIAVSQIAGPSLKPTVSNYLPVENRSIGTEKYILDASSLDSAWGFDPSRLGFESNAEVATATYVMKGKSLRLLLVMYPTQQVARKYEEGLTPGKPTGVRFKKRAGPLVAIVDPNASPEVAETLLASIRHEFQVTWNEPRPEPNAAEVILTIFKVTGVALAVTLIAGICFGVVRILVKKWFPGQVFDRPKDMEVIQLKLNQILTGRIRGGTNRLPPSAPQ